MSEVFADTNTAIEILYRDRLLDTVLVDTDVADCYNKAAEELELPMLSSDPLWNQDFTIPEKYKNIDVETLLLDTAQELGPKQTLRVIQELELFKAKKLLPVLQLLIYIVDTMRMNKVVWGVGRGSSVASYCLYLLGVHKIDSIKYDLDIHEFLK